MEKETQISAFVSQSTRDLLQKHVRATGVKKGYLVEQALDTICRPCTNCRRMSSSILSWLSLGAQVRRS